MVKPPPAYPVPAVRPVPPAVIAEKVVADLQSRRTETTVRRIDERPPRYAEWPEGLDGRLVVALRKRGIERPYTHQAAAISNALAGTNSVVVTPTASGKTLCYNVPVLDAILKDSSTRALYLFPTKALAQDQLDELHGLITSIGEEIRTFTYDGDTPADARRAVRTAGHIVLTNPDMLHAAILPHHTKWMQLFESLDYVVIDELHTYRGVFGSHLANVLRRLRRICQFYGSDPTFILCSATIANPDELAHALVGDDVELINDNGAPAGERVVVVDDHHIRPRLAHHDPALPPVRPLEGQRRAGREVGVVRECRARNLAHAAWIVLTVTLRGRDHDLPRVTDGEALQRALEPGNDLPLAMDVRQRRARLRGVDELAVGEAQLVVHRHHVALLDLHLCFHSRSGVGPSSGSVDAAKIAGKFVPAQRAPRTPAPWRDLPRGADAYRGRDRRGVQRALRGTARRPSPGKVSGAVHGPERGTEGAGALQGEVAIGLRRVEARRADPSGYRGSSP